MRRIFILLFIIIFLTSCTNTKSERNEVSDTAEGNVVKNEKTKEQSINNGLSNDTEKSEIDKLSYSDYHPVVVDGLLIGGSKTNEWLKVENITSLIKGNENYTVVDDKYDVETGIGGKTEEDEVTSAEYINIETDIDSEGTIVSYSGSWKPINQEPQKLETENDTYKKITSEILMNHGLVVNDPQINAIYRLDFDGDTTDEVLIEASYFKDDYPSPAPRKGSYSLVFLRKIVDNEVKNIEILADIYPEDLLFGKGPSYLNKILSIIDLNGDGRMEIVIKSIYYEGYGIIVYELNGDKIEAVISNVDGV